jgi:hypothetical protein
MNVPELEGPSGFAEAMARSAEAEEKLKGFIPRKGSFWGRFVRQVRRLSQRQLKIDRAAAAYAKEIGPKFALLTRQQRRHTAFADACRQVNVEYGPEPRPARRRIARAWAKKMLSM